MNTNFPVFWRWHSFGASLFRSMLALALLTSFLLFVVLGYAWSTFVDDVQRHTGELLVTQTRLSSSDLQQLLAQAKHQSENTLQVSDLGPLVSFAALLYVLLPMLLAWWTARRFARPLNQLSVAAHQLTQGDFAARAVLPGHVERRTDETATLLKDFNRMAASLERLERERRYSVAATAHELRTPVTVLRGRLEGIRDGVLPATSQEIEKLLAHTESLSRLIEDLQLLSLSEAGALHLELAPVVMQDMLTRLQADYLPRAQRQDIELLLEQPAKPVTLTIDQRRLQQVMNNLLDNAFTHTPARGLVTLCLERQPETVSIMVLNSGPGFTPEALERGLERFYTSASRERGRAGSGLGLAIARSLVEAHGGSIHLFNTAQGAGIRVTFNLPNMPSGTAMFSG